ncbi:RbsD/FucU family protein [Neiella marina]|uniref:RbsD/FucU family protein n=1 Tax=Neiella holothuriorum TaxID=2870530 RepID=A0ABS7EJG1_9GAMM|nr:RbsD/FucU family protein [Neiella holothuriorum]MBW8191906.1 RbsD/FucU family protein [Neiella holothuriorum]
MLNSKLIHPEILAALGKSGHFSQILIADGNFPMAGNVGPNAKQVYLNLAPGMVDSVTVLQALISATPFQAATVMEPPADYQPEIHTEFKSILGADVSWQHMERWSFYDKIKSPATTLMIATGEQRRFANLLLEVGVVKLPSESF